MNAYNESSKVPGAKAQTTGREAKARAFIAAYDNALRQVATGMQLIPEAQAEIKRASTKLEPGPAGDRKVVEDVNKALDGLGGGGRKTFIEKGAGKPTSETLLGKQLLPTESGRASIFTMSDALMKVLKKIKIKAPLDKSTL
jgi:hypothetical protein